MSNYRVQDPATGQVIETWPAADEAVVEEALEAAATAFDAWRRRPVSERAACLLSVADVMEERAEALARLLTTEMGKPVREAVAEVKLAASIYRYYGENGAQMMADTPIPSPLGGEAVIRKQPLGVLLGVMPWNFPYYQTSRFVAPNILAGNVTLVKPASQCPASARALAELAQEAGLPAGVYADLRVSSGDVAAVVADPRIVGVSVTGSETAGAAVAEVAGRHLKKAVLELGGSDAFIVLSTDDLDRTVAHALAGRMTNAGQACNSAKRFIVVDDLYNDFLAKLKSKLERVMPGDPQDPGTRYGPLSSADAVAEMSEFVEDARAKGATVQVGGRPIAGDGCYFQPTLLTDVAPGMRAYFEEIFGPVVVVHRVADAAAAVALANASPYGLGAAVFSRDDAEAEELASQLEVGQVWINSAENSMASLPFGGVKRSGFGRELGPHGVDEFVNHKLIHRAAAATRS